ncbi:unnamed protein product [Acanthosepion pharaonis]|uniref:Centrosomal protein kizuna n=1 Tax=Acanthosepion pharaonis TaxID=158019 RepID=A0A812CR66_ACAPH|nr:unnamed protein product [Sepia pharaonis]
MDSYDYEFYERLKNLITVVRESEQQRLQLEWRLNEWKQPDMKNAKEKATRLQRQLRLMKEEDKISKERNEDIKRHLNKLDAHLKVITMTDENLHFLKRKCKNHLVQEHPNWKQYMAVLQSQLKEALQKVNGISEIMVQVPFEHRQEMQQDRPEEEIYNIEPSTFYQQFQVPQQIVIEGGTKMYVPESFANEELKEDPKETKTDPKQESHNLLGTNAKKAVEVVDLNNPQFHQDKISKKLEEFEGEIQKEKPPCEKSQLSPEAEYHHLVGNVTATMEDYVGHETPRKQTSFENLLPARSSLSPESQNRRIVKPVFSDIELTGDFESQIIYGKTPPSKSSKPVDPEGKSINDFQLLDASSELKKRSIEAATAAAEDTDFGILSLPENHLPASAAARASASESGQRKTGDVTTADGFDTGVSNSIPGIHLSHSLSNPEERSYISDLETENSHPIGVKDMQIISHPSDLGMFSVNHRQSKKNLRRSSSPVTPALSVKGLLLLMKMVEDSFQTVSCSKDEYYRSFQPSDEERGRIISEANNEGASTIDADPALVSMIILEQMTVIIRSLSTGCLLSDTLLQSENLMNLCESDIKSQLPFNSVILWESLFVHFTSILKHKVMSPKEVAAVFVPCLLQSGSTCQEKAFKLLVQYLEHVNRNLMSSAMGIDELSDNSTDISYNAVPQRHEEQTMKDKQEWVTSIERAFSDGMDDDNRNLDEELGKEKSSELNISHTLAYKNMLYGFKSSISVEEDIENSDSETDELEKEFGTSIPDARQR